MNVGLSSLTALKVQLLNEGLRSDTTYDPLITAIGLGMADKIETFCNRKFARVVGDVYLLPGGRMSIITPRYPLEAVASVESIRFAGDTWYTHVQIVDWFLPDSGLISFGAPVSSQRGQIRVTYTGGLWWDTTEDASGTLPVGATAVPDGIRSAWILQCQQVWRRIDKLGLSIGKLDEDNKLISGMSDLALIPIVKDMLSAHVRQALI